MEAERQELIETLIYKDVPSMEQFLADNLQDIVWPRETAVDFDIREGGWKVMLDVDLPEIEDMPTKLAAVPSHGLKLSVKEMAAGKVRRMYMEHIHGIVFRLIGETFAALPAVQTVVASDSQRRDSSTGGLQMTTYCPSVLSAGMAGNELCPPGSN